MKTGRDNVSPCSGQPDSNSSFATYALKVKSHTTTVRDQRAG